MPAAIDDLQAIALYIADDNPDRVARFVVAERPLSFPARDEIAPGLRSASHGRYLLFFRDLPGEVRIVRVLHSARQVRGMFAP